MTDNAVTPMPRGWLSLALLVWGGFTEALPSAVVMAVMLEAINFSPVKWALTAREFHRAADLTSVLFGVVTVVQFSRYSVHGIYEILVVMPYCFFPLLLAQRASTAQTIPMSALFYSLRRYPEHDRPLDVAPHYVVVCILAASTTDERGYVFIGLCALLVVGLLAAARPQRYRRWQWIAAIALAAGAAAATQFAVLRSHGALEQSFMYWFNQFPWASGDPNRARTAIGAIGRLKLSDQIRVRVTPGPHVALPLLLQEASYDTFKFGSWSAKGADFEALDTLGSRSAWRSADMPVANTSDYEITIQHRRELTVLPIPRGTREVASEEIAELQQNRFGTLLAESPPGALRFRARAGAPIAVEPPPTAADLHVPDAYAAVLETTAAEIGSDPATPRVTADRIRNFFLDNFTYSLIQRGGFGRRTPLAHFLTRTRRGHCEYFATAAVLLLRQAGIPARYAVGYVVEDYSELERAYIARARHAHAWALAHVDGEWITVDATPSVWFGLENELASRWQAVQDLGGWVWYRLQRLNQADFEEFNDLLLWLVPPLAIVLYFRLRKSPLAVQDEGSADPPVPPDTQPLDVLLAALERRGLSPEPGETLRKFFARALPSEQHTSLLEQLLQRYYRLRFDARAHDAGERSELRELATRTVKELRLLR